MSIFGDDNFESAIGRVKFTQHVRELFKIVGKAKWKAKLVFWDPETGEEWEVTPVGSRRTKNPTVHVKCVVVPKEQT